MAVGAAVQVTLLAPEGLTQVAEGGDYDPLRDKSYQQTRLGPSVVDFLAWKETGGAADSTLDQYERDLARGALMYPSTGLEEWSDEQMLHVASSFKPKERYARVAAYRSFFRWATRTRRRSTNPCDALPDMRKQTQRVYDVFSEEEIAVLCDIALRDGALMQLLFDAGLRKGEARRFKLGHLRVTPDSALVTVLGGKGGKDREVPATLGVQQRVAELALLDGLRPAEHLWYGTEKTPHWERVNRGTPIGEGTFARWWRRCLDEAGVRYRNPHTTRHTFATRYLRRGGSLERLSMLMGHASIKTTFDEYAHLVTADIVNEFERVFG